MNFTELILTSLALSVDAAVCSVIFGNRSLSAEIRLKYALSMALTFGLFQFLMPLIGFYGGHATLRYIEKYDHWIAFALLALVSANMLKEAFDRTWREIRKISVLLLLSLGIATSIDALAVGFSLGLTRTADILNCAAIIGIICFCCTIFGFIMGQQLSRIKYLNKMLNIVGAVTLLAIGLKILSDHEVF